jgi:hypothetical protein
VEVTSEIRKFDYCNKYILLTMDNISDPVQRFKHWYVQLWRGTAGSCVDEFIRDRNSAVQQVGHASPTVRSAALALLALYWEATSEDWFAQLCETMGLTDPDQAVRSIALSLVGSCHRNTHDRRVGELLARVVLDDEQPSESRRAAYLGILYLIGHRPAWLDATTDPPTPFQFPDDVKWAIVNRFAPKFD